MSKWIKELRITHYLKNCLIFLPAFFGGFINVQNTWRNLVAGFICFCLGASAVYLMNDIKELNEWIESLNIIKMSHLSNLFYIFNAIPVKIFYKYCPIDSKIYMERNKFILI